MQHINSFVKLALSVLLASVGLLQACNNSSYTPKPRGYFRIDFPEKKYQKFDSTFPYTFEYPKYATVNAHPAASPTDFWINISFPKQKAYMHLTYKHVDKNIDTFLEDTYTLAYKHSIRADAIRESAYANDTAQVYGLLYDIKGDAASSIQFFVTDSVQHFLRGALYFRVHPNKDSLAPVVKFIDKDVVHLMESLRWK